MLSEPTSSVAVSAQANLGLAFGVVYGVTYQRRLTVAVIHLANTTNADLTVRVSIYPDGGTPTNANALLWDFIVPKYDFLEFGEGLILLSKWSLAALASAGNSVTLTLSGIEQ